MHLEYKIRKVQRADLGLLAEWRTQPQISRWWGQPDVEPEEDKLDDPSIAIWIAEHEDAPFAFIQDYAVNDWLPHHFDFLPNGSRGIDMYIGEARLRGLGHGCKLLRQHVDKLFADGIPAVGIDPHPENQGAIEAFKKSGFRIVGGPIDTRWSRAVLMVRYASRAGL
jgi:aminoglycoside 6'-N-acetyltransferase